MSKSTQLAKNTILYAIGSLGTKLLTFLIVPLYTYYIDTSNMGVYDAIITAVSLLAPVVVWSIYEGTYRWAIEDKKNASLYVKYGLHIEIRNIAIAVLLIFIFNIFVEIPYVFYVVFYLITLCLSTYFTRMTRALGRTKLFTINGLLYTIIYLGLNVYLVVFVGMGIPALLLSSIVAHAITTTLLVYILRKEIWGIKLEKTLTNDEKKKITVYSLANTPNDICWWVVGLSDRFALIWFVATSANGIYSISQKFPTIISLLTTIFYYAWQDQALTTYSDNDKDVYYTSVFKLYSKFLLAMTLCLIPATKYVILWMMEMSYQTAWFYVMPLYLGAVFQAFASFFGIGYQGSKQNIRALTTTGTAALINVGINLIFMPVFPESGIWIASISTVISYFVLFVMRAIQSKRYFDVKINITEISLLIGLNICCGIAMMFTNLLIDVFIFGFCIIVACIVCKEYFVKALHMVQSFVKRRKG